MVGILQSCGARLANAAADGARPLTVIQVAQSLFQGGQVELALLARVERLPQPGDPVVGNAWAVCVHGVPAIVAISWLWVATTRRQAAARTAEAQGWGRQLWAWGMRSASKLGVLEGLS